jgi:translation initiation factor 1
MEFDFDDDNIPAFKAHITIQQRNSKKYITSVSGIPTQYDLPKILKYIKKFYKCGGSIVKDEHGSCVIQVTGDQRYHIRDFFIECDVMDADQIVLHGF